MDPLGFSEIEEVMLYNRGFEYYWISRAMPEQTWLVRAIMYLPMREFSVLKEPLPGSPFPQQLGPPLKVLDSTIRFVVNNCKYILQPYSSNDLPNEPSFQIVELLTEVVSGKAAEVADTLTDDLDWITNQLSLQLQYGIYISQLEILDVTKPINNGDDRELLLYPMPKGFPTIKYNQTHSLNIAPSSKVNINCNDNCSKKVKAALRWYVKSLSTTFDIDKFIFLWISLEVLCSVFGEKIYSGYKASCGHKITKCPECGKDSINKPLQGDTIKNYLIKLGCSESDARIMWKIRQMVHGDTSVDNTMAENLTRKIILLHTYVLNAIKDALGLPNNSPPFITGSQVGIGLIQFSSARKISESDLIKF